MIICRGVAVLQRPTEEEGFGAARSVLFHLRLGHEMTVRMLDDVKALGFHYATHAGISIGIDDLVNPFQKKGNLVDEAEREVLRSSRSISTAPSPTVNVTTGSSPSGRRSPTRSLMRCSRRWRIRPGEAWRTIPSTSWPTLALAGAQQIRQLAGMRGLMAQPSGEIIETPIRPTSAKG